MCMCTCESIFVFIFPMAKWRAPNHRYQIIQTTYRGLKINYRSLFSSQHDGCVLVSGLRDNLTRRVYACVFSPVVHGTYMRLSSRRSLGILVCALRVQIIGDGGYIGLYIAKHRHVQFVRLSERRLFRCYRMLAFCNWRVYAVASCGMFDGTVHAIRLARFSVDGERW